MGSHYNRKGPSVSSTSRKTSFSSSLIVERWRAEHQLQFPSTLHKYRIRQVRQIWQTRGDRMIVTVTKANNRKHKTSSKNSQNASFGTLFYGENKIQAKASLAANNRSPCPCTSQSAVLYVVLSTAHLSSIRKIEKCCSKSFSGLIFQVLRTLRSSVSITLSVFKQKEQKVALRRRIFLGHTQPAIHPAWTRVQKCPADPDWRHFVNSPHSRLGGFVAQWLERATRIRKTLSSIPGGSAVCFSV